MIKEYTFVFTNKFIVNSNFSYSSTVIVVVGNNFNYYMRLASTLP